MEGKVEEIDRGRIDVGMETRVHIDSLPELTMPADLTAISPLTEQSFEWPRTSSFRAYGHIRQPDPRLRPAMNGNMDVIVSRIPNAISIPAKAVFTRNGKPIVYVPDKAGYRAVEVELLARNPDEVAVKGIQAGTMVTLVEVKPDRTKDEKK
jgi:macrolide-specific efflux system membrane fusion protein